MSEDASEPDRALTIETAAYGRVVFDIDLPGYREEILCRRAPDPARLSPDALADALAAACVASVSGRNYNPVDVEKDKDDLVSLTLGLTPAWCLLTSCHARPGTVPFFPPLKSARASRPGRVVQLEVDVLGLRNGRLHHVASISSPTACSASRHGHAAVQGPPAHAADFSLVVRSLPGVMAHWANWRQDAIVETHREHSSPKSLMKIIAHILTCPERAAVLQNTLASLRNSDWGAEPVVLMNEAAHPDRRLRIQHGTRAVLERALATDADFILYLEDDVAVGQHLRHNLTQWAPLRAAAAEIPFFATLFRAPGVPVLEERPAESAVVLSARESFGNLGLVLSRATARYALEHWAEESLEADTKLARLAGRLGPVLAHAPSLVQHLGGKSTWGGMFLQTADFAPLWQAGQGSAGDASPLTEENARSALEAFAASLPPGPQDLSGAGIVIAAGGLGYLANAWVAVTMLRHHGCELPIELWHLGPEEMPAPLARRFAARDVRCVDAHEQLNVLPARRLRGWAIKPYAALAAPFRHVLLLDADNVPASDPTHLLESTQYREYGAVFWPDRASGVGIEGGLLQANHPIWRLTGLDFRGDPSFDSGQVCVDKLRCWRQLRLALWMNEHADFWYQYLYGDKDTFQIAWRKLDTPWAMPSKRPLDGDERVFWQADFDGRMAFQHRHGDKWRLDARNPAIPGFLEEPACRAAIDELRRELFRDIQVGDGDTEPPVAPGSWLWIRLGRRPCVLRFGPGGFVEGGQDKAARLWRARDGELELLDDELVVSGRFRFVPRTGRWNGRGAEGALLVPVGASSSG